MNLFFILYISFWSVNSFNPLIQSRTLINKLSQFLNQKFEKEVRIDNKEDIIFQINHSKSRFNPEQQIIKENTRDSSSLPRIKIPYELEQEINQDLVQLQGSLIFYLFIIFLREILKWYFCVKCMVTFNWLNANLFGDLESTITTPIQTPK